MGKITHLINIFFSTIKHCDFFMHVYFFVDAFFFLEKIKVYNLSDLTMCNLLGY